ncbi:CpxP family protein [Vibrio sp. LaRot3]|uniref:CpxP family protein n=1 Tax=Vibrio sp. LaRot3 TaxID=2998829 RepID=UPI0022CE00BB|nr:CpxP family protein [Vibrio sp. LaRot3]MDA0150356.1 CpxP family protein [Vibrio sp. LaRot3]
MKLAKKLVLAAAVVPLALGSASALAFGGKGDHKGPHGKCGMGMDRGIMKQLDLTDAQKEQFKEMRTSNKEEMKAKFEANFEAHKAERQAYQEQVQQLVLADNFDQAAANELAKQMVEKQTERRVKMLEKQHQMLSVLTPEQKAKFVELSKERAEKCAEQRKDRN